MSQECRDWVTVSSFFPPPVEEPAFEEILAAEVARWRETAQDAGLDPDSHIQVARGQNEVEIQVSSALNAYFSPCQTLWRAE